MKTAKSEDDNINFVTNNDFIVIGVDGWDGVGKSTLSNNIAGKLNIKHFDVDDYRDNENKSFLESIQYEKLKNDIFNQKGKIIVSSICLLQILKEIKVPLGLLIYIKNNWEYHKEAIDSPLSSEEFLKNEHDSLNCYFSLSNEQNKIKPFNPNCYEFQINVLDYHKKHKPHEKAKIIFNSD